ncbi:MAG: peptide deformylase, partial [Bdellovibrionota bacterium]
MEEYGGIGLAAPQIHVSLAVAVIQFNEANQRYPDMGAQALTLFINPKITVTNPDEQGFWEGCLSVPDLKGLVYRPSGIRVDYLDETGTPQVL